MARYSIEVARGVAEVDPRNDYIALIDPGAAHPAILELESRGVQLMPLGLGGSIGRYRERRPGPIISVLEAPIIGSQLRRCAPDVVHWMGQPPPYVLPGVTSVATLYDLYGYSEAARSLDVAKRLGAWQHRLLRGMHAVICISDETRTSAISELNLSDARCVTIPPPVASFDLSDSPPALISESGQKPFLLHVGILTPRKNPKVLLESFALISQRHPDLELWCVGPYQVNPAAAENVITWGRALGIETRVRLIGDVSDNDLAHLYRACAAFVFPSLKEGFGYPAVEAICHHAQCVLADIPALHEAAGDLAQYADPGDPVAFAAGVETLLEAEQRQEVVSNYAQLADAWVQRFSKREIATRLLAVYRDAALAE